MLLATPDREHGIRQDGEKEGSGSIVRRQAELMFGPLGPEALTRLDTADEAALVRCAERVLTATTVEDVLGE